jgi:hypothetical protein
MRQATKVREIYNSRLKQGFEFIAVVGDLNDTPYSNPLRPLLNSQVGLIDITKHNKFVKDDRVGT